MQYALRSSSGRTTLNDKASNIPWRGLLGLIVILTVISIIAYQLSSIGGFIAGVFAVFVGLIVSFFRSDLKRILGLEKKDEYREVPVVEADADKKHIRKLEKKIAKERTKLAKTVGEYDENLADKKKRKLDQEILRNSTEVIALLDQAKAHAIQLKEDELVEHYEGIIEAIEEIRRTARARLGQ